MKNQIFTIVSKELARFFGDKRMVFSTVLMPGLLIYVMYTFLGQGMMSQFHTQDSYVAKAYVQNMPEELSPMLHEFSAEWIEIEDDSVENVKAMIRNKEADILLTFPENFSAIVKDYEVTTGGIAPNVEIYFNSTESESQNMRSNIITILNAYEASMINKFDVNNGTGTYDMATDKDVTGQIYAMLLPMLLMTFLYSGCIAVAPESIAGEKERGTVATLLVTPMKRSSLALGKIFSLSIIALLSGISSFAGTMLALPKMMGASVDGMDVGVYVLTDYLLLLGIILTTVLILVALISIISAFAKSIKEASTAVAPLMIVVIVISLIPMITGGGGKNIIAFFIPLYNSVQCMHGVFSFTYLPIQMIITMVVNIIYACGLAWVLTKLFHSEKVMFS